MLDIVILMIIVVCISLWQWQKQHFAYWERKKLANIPPTPFVGNVKNLLLYRCCFGEQFQQLYEHPEAMEQPFVGIHVLHNHALLLREPELIKRVL
ncbi:hypothetical protein PSTG_18296, partial [Puccinia striiformis f. sp. tritici PST-78]